MSSATARQSALSWFLSGDLMKTALVDSFRRLMAAVKPGEAVETVILGVNQGERRISLGLKQALGDPWAEVAQKFAVEPGAANLEGFCPHICAKDPPGFSQ